MLVGSLSEGAFLKGGKMWKYWLLPCLFFSLITGSIEADEIEWTGIVLHHSDSNWGTVEDIDKWHKERGWDGIGYHFVINREGWVRTGRDLSKEGAHARGRNKTHIGICLIGKKSFTEPQKRNLRHLCNELRLRYPILSIEPHHDQCPGEGLDEKYFWR